MTIRNDKELQMFENAIDRCRSDVWLITRDGAQYNLKTPMDRYRGITKMLNARTCDEPELFTSCIEDEMVIFDFFQRRQNAA